MEPKERLKEARDETGLNQADFGEPLGLSQANVRDLESGKVKFSTLHALAIENVYGYKAKWLLNGVGVKKSKATEYVHEQEVPYNEHPEINNRIISLPGLLDLDDEEFCQKLGTDVSELDKVKAGRPVSGLLIRAVAYEFGVRMRWLKMGEQPIRNLSGAPDHFAQEMWGLIQQAAKKP